MHLIVRSGIQPIPIGLGSYRGSSADAVWASPSAVAGEPQNAGMPKLV